MRSLPPKDFQTLPKLGPPAGYICVIRDIDHDDYRIEGTDHPATLLDEILDEAAGAFGIELLSLLETQNLAQSQAELYQRHHARLSRDWLDLDPYQLQELRQSILRIDAHPSHYLATPPIPPSLPKIEKTVPPVRRLFGKYPRPSRRMKPGPAVYKQYGARALSQHRQQEMRRARQQANEPLSWRQKLLDGTDRLLLNYPGLIISILVILMFIVFFVIGPMPRY